MCSICKVRFYRKRYPCGKLHSLKSFKNKQFCSNKCSAEFKTLKLKIIKCRHCNRDIPRLRIPSGDLEQKSKYLKHKYCLRCKKLGFNITTKEGSRYRSRKLIDNSICTKCNKDYGRIEVHHIDENPFNNNLSNLISLCVSCHRLLHGALRRVKRDNDHSI
jgi:hypothetical protein